MASPCDILSTHLTDCEQCGAKASELCHGRNGKITKTVHYQRRYQLQQWRKNGHQKEYASGLMEALKSGAEYGTSRCG